VEYAVSQKVGGTTIDKIRLERSGVITIDGWDESQSIQTMPDIGLLLDNDRILFTESHRIFRPDVADALNVTNFFLGFSFEFLVTKPLTNSLLEILLNGIVVWSQASCIELLSPHYASFFNELTVKHRDDIYGHGPPADCISEEIIRLSDILIERQAKLLDFGCGRGNLVNFLRKKGAKAFGIEMDCPPIREAMLPDMVKYIKLYDGQMLLPYEKGEFDIVIAIEVLEHIKDFRLVLQEISRISKQKFIITVPDASAIPRCYLHNVVPWHLLESTHINFFTEKSLRNVLSDFWGNITLIKMGHVQINDIRFATSIVAICES